MHATHTHTFISFSFRCLERNRRNDYCVGRWRLTEHYNRTHSHTRHKPVIIVIICGVRCRRATTYIGLLLIFIVEWLFLFIFSRFDGIYCKPEWPNALLWMLIVEWVQIGQNKSTNKWRLQHDQNDSLYVPLKNKNSRIRAADRTGSWHPSAIERFQFHTVPRWPHNFWNLSPSNAWHTETTHTIFKENDPFTAHKWRDKYARGQRSHIKRRLQRYGDRTKINSNIYEITFLFMTLSREWVSGSSFLGRASYTSQSH